MFNAALKNESSEATVKVSAPVPMLIVNEPVGLTKAVVSKVPPWLRIREIPSTGVPSSSRIALSSPPPGRLKIILLGVPKLKRSGSRLEYWIEVDAIPVDKLISPALGSVELKV